MPRSVLLRRLCLQMEAVRARICKSLWGPGIDSDDSIPPAYVAWRVGTTNRVVVPARQAGNRFLGSLKGLQIRALKLGCSAQLLFRVIVSNPANSLSCLLCTICNSQRPSARMPVLIGVLPGLARGERQGGQELYCDRSLEGCPGSAALADAAQLPTKYCCFQLL
jgi:hypothetical protein